MLDKIIIVGSGQHARVVLYNIKAQGRYEVFGFLDNDVDKIGNIYEGYPVISGYSADELDYIKEKHGIYKFFIGFGNMKYRKSVFNHMINCGWEAVNIVHPNAVVSQEAQLGKGVLIECGCLITPNPIIGNNVVINTGSQVNHDNYVADHVYIASGVVLSGGITIQENTLVDDGVIICLGRTVGKNSLIGGGSVVTKDIPDHVVAYGNPCKVIRENVHV